jgi:putative ABC transport system permease protein
MAAIALRGLAVRKLRAGLTALAIALGVMMISGTYVLTDTINSAFDDIFQEGSKGTDVAIVPHKAVDSLEIEVPPLDASLLERAKRVEGVKQASGSIFGDVRLIGQDGKELTSGQAPNFASAAQPEPFNAFNYVKGRPPRTAGETAIDRFTADRKNLKLGDRIGVVGEGAQTKYAITGIAKFGDVASFGGASVAILTLPEAQKVTGRVGKLDEIDIQAAPGVSPQTLVQRLDPVMPASVDVRTGKQNADQQSQDNRDELSFLTTALLVFAGIALFVGAFIIFNTFSITVAQRTHELGVLRTLGATRRQVLGSVMLEALVIGLGASLIGLVAGIAYAKGIRGLFLLLDIDLPSSGTVIATRTIIVSLIVGTVVTVAASLSPALRSTRVSPIEALREGVALPPGRGARFRTPLTVLLLVVGLALVLYGLFGVDESGPALSMLGLGAVAVFLAVGLLSPRLVRPIAAIVGRPIERVRGITGRLARENSMRNPSRTATTAASLMIGLAVVTFVATFAAGLKAGTNDTVDKSFAGDLVLLNKTTPFDPIPAAVEKDVAKVDGVKTVTGWRSSQSEVKGVSGTAGATGLDPATAPDVFEFDWHKGSSVTFSSLGPNDAVIDRKFGEKNNIDVGDRMQVTTPTGKHTVYTVRGSINDNADFVGDYVLPIKTLARDFDQRKDDIVLIDLQPAANVPVVRQRIKHLLDTRFPTVENLDQQGLKDKQGAQFDQLLMLIYALLSLAVVVSLFGIVNTLVLSIYERTRELGMLRAIGMSRRQVKQVIRYESVITALMGAVLGMVIGVALALVISRPISDEGFILTFPVLSLVIFLILAAIAGVLAAIPPARRAARLNVLEALAYE